MGGTRTFCQRGFWQVLFVAFLVVNVFHRELYEPPSRSNCNRAEWGRQTKIQGWGWRRKTGLSPPVKYFTDRSKAVLLLWIFYVFVLSCVCYVLCTSVYMCFVVTCWERADLLALVCGVFCEFVTFPLVSWVRCGTWLYRFLIFAPLLTFI